MTTTKQYDYLNRLTQISSAPGAAYTLPLTYNYNYNPANQRTKDTLADGSYWVYGYDSLGQVTNGCKYFATGTPVPGQQFDYTFDTIGNRLQTMSGGNANGANLRLANYTNNSLNQIIGRDIPTNVDIMGASISTNTVIGNGQTAYRNQEYYRQQLLENNASSALGNVYVPKEPENFSYDLDGNLLRRTLGLHLGCGKPVGGHDEQHGRGAALRAWICVRSQRPADSEARGHQQRHGLYWAIHYDLSLRRMESGC